MRSPSAWLLKKEWRALMASRAWWIMLALIGPLVGACFTNAVRAFSEVSAGAGPGCGFVCDPLIGVFAPTLAAYEVAAIFLLPFVAIRLVSGDRQSGALKLEVQRPFSSIGRVSTKAVVLGAGWVASMGAVLIAVALWKSYGGQIYLPSLAIAMLGQILNAGLTVALAIAAASIASHPSTAAVVTLAVTVGTWVVALAATVYGGVWQQVANLTPVAMLSLFQRGLLQVDVTIAALVFIAAGIGVGAVWVRLGIPVSRRVVETAAIAAAAVLIAVGGTFVHASADASEGRLNSFSEPEEETLRHLAAPLSIEAHLAPEDPRRLELERRSFAKLRRALPSVRITYIARTTSGLYEQSDPGYGEIWYQVGARRQMSRTATDEGVLESIFAAADVAPGNEIDAPYPGHPLVTGAPGANVAFYAAWPVAVGVAGFLMMRKRT